MTDDEFDLLLGRGYETSGVEFKGPGTPGDPSFAKVIRAMLGMANHRDGGRVIIGVAGSAPPDPVGMDEDQADLWAYDGLAARVNEYASPCLRFDVGRLRRRVGGVSRDFVILHVREFDDIPVLC